MQVSRISVVMPIYNAGEYVEEAIQSILDQTFQDFELIIINDGSSDDSLAKVAKFKDKRIKLLSHDHNVGNYPSRNEGIRRAKGKYICVMDADDVALKTRLERQFCFMENHPEIGLAGSGFRYYGNNQDIFRESEFERIKILLLRNNCFIHPTIIIRHDLLIKYQLFYNEKYFYAADYDLVVRAARFFQVTNINEILLLYRLHENQITSRYRAKQAEFADVISIDQLRLAGIYPDPDEAKIHLSLLKGVPLSFKNASKLNIWIEKLLKCSDSHYDQVLLKSYLKAICSYQSFCWMKEDDDFKHPVMLTKKHKLKEFEILIPVRVDSYLRMENILTLIIFISHNFSVPIRVLESASVSALNFLSDYKNVSYHYFVDENPVFNKTECINRLIRLAGSEYIIVWDADVVVNSDQIVESTSAIKTGKYSIALPYNGRAIKINKVMSRMFQECISTDLFRKLLPSNELMYDYHNSCRIYVVNKEYFLLHGVNNEIISERGLEDANRIKRMEASGLPVFRSEGVLFHLFHPRNQNSTLVSRSTEVMSRLEFIKTCELC